MFTLAGLLEQQTSLDPREIAADTRGYSEVVFGLFVLLGYRFSPGRPTWRASASGA